MSISASTSRFALLPDDDNTDFVAPKSKAEKKREKERQRQKEEADKAKALAKKKNSEANQLRNLAFGGGSKKKNKKKGASNNNDASVATSEEATSEKAASPDKQEFEDWKEKDKKLVDDQYKEDLTKALIESKISAEAEKTASATSNGLPGFPDYDPVQRSDGQPVNPAGKKPAGFSGGKPAPLSLDAFNALSTAQLKQISQGLPPNLTVGSVENNNLTSGKAPATTDDFFDKVNEDALKLIRREQRLEELKRGPVGPPVQNHNPDERLNPEASSAENSNLFSSPRNPRIELKMKEVENGLLRRENDALKEKIDKLTNKVKDLVTILSDTETREKTELVVGLRKITKIKDEYAEEIKRLHKECEREKTRSHELAKELRRIQSGSKSGGNSTSIS